MVRRTHLSLPDKRPVSPVTEDGIRAALEACADPDPFVILRRDDGAFMQAHGTVDDGYYLEYQLREGEALYAATDEALPAERVARIMTRFARYEPGWRNALGWAEAAYVLAGKQEDSWWSWWHLAGVALVVSGIGASAFGEGAAPFLLMGSGVGAQVVGALRTGRMPYAGRVSETNNPVSFGCLVVVLSLLATAFLVGGLYDLLVK